MSDEKTKFCNICQKEVIPESRKEYMGWLFGYTIKEKFCPNCGIRLTSNTKFAWVTCCLIFFIVVMIIFFTGSISG